MKKPFIYLLTAGLAVSMIANTSTVKAVEADSKNSNATVEFTPGELSLVSVSGITFSGVAIEAGDSTATSDEAVSAEVSDLRGTHAGWTLTAEIGNFSEVDSTEGDPITLEGTTLNFATGHVESDDNAYVENGVLLTAGGDQDTLMAAAVENGIGESTATWEAGNIELTVPQSVVTQGSHTATINWVLDNSPGDSIVDSEA